MRFLREPAHKNEYLWFGENMSAAKPITSIRVGPAERQAAFDRLCAWIEGHLDEPIGWRELMRESGLDHQAIHQLFFTHTRASPMTWIRKLREARSLPPEERTPLPMVANRRD